VDSFTYGGFERSPARANPAAMLTPGGYLLSKRRVTENWPVWTEGLLETMVCAGARRSVRGTHACRPLSLQNFVGERREGQNTLFGVPEISRHEAVLRWRL
jgi:hypothetical protein